MTRANSEADDRSVVVTGPDGVCSPSGVATEVEPVVEVMALFARRGAGHYGESLDQERHALQCAALAGNAGADDALVAAALLHDFGHLLSGADTLDAPFDRSVDDEHESVGARWLAPRFGPAVAGIVALHVTAKRYRCTVDPGALDRLSPASLRSLRLQGGTLDQSEVARFTAHPASGDALALREWDEAAKDPEAVTPDLASFAPLLTRLAEVRSGPSG